MMPFLQKAGISVACVGNHDFDFGIETLGDLVSRTPFPWLMSNVKMKATGDNLSNTKDWEVVSHAGYKIGLIGLAEFDWLETINTI